MHIRAVEKAIKNLGQAQFGSWSAIYEHLLIVTI